MRIGRRLSCALVGIFLTLAAAADGVDPADTATFERARREAAAGSIEAMYELGNMYLFGVGVPANEPDADQRAAQFYFEAARRGHAGAQHALGILFLTGKGVQQDAAEAQKWFRRAAEQGHAPSRPLSNGSGR